MSAVESHQQVAPQRSTPAVLCRVVGGEALLLDVRTGDYFSLDPLGTEIWERLHDGEPVEAITASIAERHRVDPEVVLADVEELVAELRDARLWERS
jgi:hypothetical protein